MGYIGKMAKIKHLAIINYLNGIFHANFASWYQWRHASDFLEQVLGVKIFAH